MNVDESIYTMSSHRRQGKYLLSTQR